MFYADSVSFFCLVLEERACCNFLASTVCVSRGRFQEMRYAVFVSFLKASELVERVDDSQDKNTIYTGCW